MLRYFRYALLLSLFTNVSLAQIVPFPTGYRDYEAISPWGYTNTGTTWNTAPYLPFIYRDMWYRLMPPNEVVPSVVTNGDGTIASISFNYTVPGKKYPLILFFQGAGETGNNNNKQLLHGGERHKNAVLSGEFPGYLLYPQSVDPVKAKALIDKMLATYPSIDPNRIYVHGLSNGAVWTWEFAVANPTLVAAMAPMSGVHTTSTDPDLLYTPIRLAQGGLDNNPNPAWTQTIVDWFKNNGGHLEYLYYPTLGHGTWNTVYSRSDFFSWFLSHKKNEIQVLFSKNEFCAADPVSATLGFTPGFEAYEWQKDGVTMAGETAFKIVATEYGSYTGRIRNRGVWSAWSSPVEVKIKAQTITPPIQSAIPQSLVVPDINGNSNVSLTLPAGYETYTYNVAGNPNPIGTTQSLVVTGPGSYTATVKEFNGCASTPSVPFVVADANGSPKPDAIANLQAATLSLTSIRVTWENNITPVVNETGFEIYRALSAAGPYTFVTRTAADVLAYNDLNLASNTTFYYKVRPVAANGAAVAAGPVAALTDVDSTPPTAPNNLAVTGFTTTSVSLSWSAATDAVGVVGYDVYVRPYGQTNYIKAYSTTLLTQTVFQLSPSTLYSFIVKARDAGGNASSASPQVNQATRLVGLNYSYYHGTWTVLPDFSLLTPVATGIVTTFSIAPRTQNDNFGFVFTGWLQIPTSGNYTFYTESNDGSKLWVNNILRVNNDGIHNVQEVASSTVNLTAGYYPIRVEYFERTGSGGNAAETLNVRWQGPGISKQVIPANRLLENFVLPPAPAAPAGLNLTVNDYKTITVNWNNYTGTGTEIEIYRGLSNNPTTIIATIPATQRPYVNTNLSASTRYYYRLRAVNSGNVSAFTSSVNATTNAVPPLPAAPSALQMLAVTTTSTNLKWNDNSNNELNFEVFKSVGNNSSYAKVATLAAGTTLYTDNSLFAHTAYYYKVRSTNVTGASAYSNELLVTSANSNPVLTGLSDVKLRYDETNVIELSAVDADNDFIVFGSNNLPAFAQVFDYGDGTAYLSVTPTIADIGIYQGGSVYAQDLFGGIHTVPVKITVDNNHTPEVAAVDPQTVKETNAIQVAATATDLDGEPITWSFENAPSFMTSVPSGNTVNLTFNPGTNHAGVYNITLIASDPNGGVGSTVFTLTVEDYDPNFQVKVNFRTEAAYNGPADWNNVGNTGTSVGTTNLNKENGLTSGMSLSVMSAWSNYRDVYGVAAGVYPTNVNRSFLWFFGNTAHDLVIHGLNPQGTYNLYFLSSTTFDLASTWSTSFTVSGTTKTIDPENNASTLVVFNNVTSDAAGDVTITVRGPANGYAALNAMVIESYFEGTEPPPAPSDLEVSVAAPSIQVAWDDNSSNEQSFDLQRSTDNLNFTTLATLAKDVAQYSDNNYAAGTTYYYRVRSSNSIGYSTFSNTGSIVAPNRLPVILPVPQVSVAEQDMQWLEVTATDGDGDLLTFTLENEPAFMWSEYVDDNRVNLVFAPASGDRGAYSFLLHADDGHGGIATATISLSVFNPTDLNYKINFTAGPPLPAAPWNNVSNYFTANFVVPNLRDNNNVASTISMTVVNPWGGVNTNGYTSGNNSGIYPDNVTSSSFFINDNASRSLLMSGLNPTKTYDFTFYASRIGVADVRNTVYTIGSKSAILNASGNISNVATVIGVRPAANGQLTVSVAKEATSQFGYLGAMIIREYDAPIIPTVPNTPLALISQVLTRNSIKLNWQDASTDETSFEIWRSVSTNSNYALWTTLAAGSTTYTNTGLATSTQYFYKVRAINNVGPSPYSGETSASTFEFSVSLNMNGFDGAPPNWNNFPSVLSAGYVANNLIDDVGSNTGISMTVVTPFTGENQFGMNTGNNSGIVPDLVMKGAFYLDPQGLAVLRFGNLSFLRKYNFSFFGSRNGGGDRTTVYTINGTAVTLDASFNISNIAQIKDVSPALDGTVTIQITTTLTALYGYLNGLIIQAVPNTGGGGGRIAADETLEENTTEIESKSLGVTVSPNPFADEVKIQLGNDVSSRLKVSIINTSGISMFDGNYDRKPGENEISILLGSDLASGLYIMRILPDSGIAHSVKLLKK